MVMLFSTTFVIKDYTFSYKESLNDTFQQNLKFLLRPYKIYVISWNFTYNKAIVPFV